MGKSYKNEPTVLEQIFLAILKGLWFLVTLPFKKSKFSFRRKRGLSLEDKNYITSKRLEVEKILKSDNAAELKHALFEADKLVDYKLKSEGYLGETFADKLKKREGSLNKTVYNDIWSGHKVRNIIAHEYEVNISNQEVIMAVKKLLKYTEIYD